MKKIAVLTFLFAFTATINAVFAQKPALVTSNKTGWQKIGEVAADAHRESKSIVVLGKDEFKSIKLKVTDAPINVESVQVIYESGEKEDLSVQSELEKGSETKEFALKYPSKEIEKVVFNYKTMPSSKNEKANVELWGFRAENTRS